MLDNCFHVYGLFILCHFQCRGIQRWSLNDSKQMQNQHYISIFFQPLIRGFVPFCVFDLPHSEIGICPPAS